MFSRGFHNAKETYQNKKNLLFIIIKKASYWHGIMPLFNIYNAKATITRHKYKKMTVNLLYKNTNFGIVKKKKNSFSALSNLEKENKNKRK